MVAGGRNCPTKFLKDAITARVATLAQALENLLSRVGMLMQQAHDLGAEGIEFAGAPGALTRMITGGHRPLGHGAFVQSEQACRLRDGKSLTLTA